MSHSSVVDCFKKSSPPPQARFIAGERHPHGMLPGEIPGVKVDVVEVQTGSSILLHSGSGKKQFIGFLLQGTGAIVDDEGTIVIEGKTLFAPHPKNAPVFTATRDTQWLTITMDLHSDDFLAIEKMKYPLISRYQECEKYRDYFKSEKTVSRTLVHPFTLPRFCMGSVETRGEDRIEPHAHPMLDQLFYSFPENKCTLLIDGEKYPFGGDTLLHIPLGSDHGIESREGDVVHYLWIDFFEKAEEMEYLVKIHKPVPE